MNSKREMSFTRIFSQRAETARKLQGVVIDFLAMREKCDQLTGRGYAELGYVSLANVPEI